MIKYNSKKRKLTYGMNFTSSIEGIFDEIKTSVNPYNWGVPDYSSKGSFSNAYSVARSNGEKEFLWKNKRYSTNYNGTPSQQLKETGITDSQLGVNSFIRDRIYKNITPYTGMTPTYVQAISGAISKDKNRDIEVKNPFPVTYRGTVPFRNASQTEKDFHKKKSQIEIRRAEDSWALYTGNKQRFGTYEISKNKPSKSTNVNTNYFSLNKSYPELISFLEKEGKTLKNGESKIIREGDKLSSDLVLRNFKISKGKDEKGEYISYYDNWNLNPSMEFPFPEQGKPFEIYDRIYLKDYGDGVKKRMYYSDKELNNIDFKNKNFDTLALQRELNNRGYALVKSKKKNGDFDGVFGQETMDALNDFKKKQK